MRTSVIGIGTGVTAGVLSQLERISHLDIIEISDAVINSIPALSPENLNFHQSPKATLYKNDAFQFFKTTQNKYDIIISEPSNPWMVGIENLFTPYFYEIAKSRLKKDGVLVQWLHSYSLSQEILTTIIKNLNNSFKNIVAYDLFNGDIIFILSNKNQKWNTHQRGNLEDAVYKILKEQGIDKVLDLDFMLTYNPKVMNIIHQIKPTFHHEIFHPKLSQRAYYDFFLGLPSFRIYDLIDPYIRRALLDDRSYLFERLSHIVSQKGACLKAREYDHFDCEYLIPKYKKALRNIRSNFVKQKLSAYSILRENSLIKKDIGFIKMVFNNLASKSKSVGDDLLIKKIIEELIKEHEFDFAISFVKKAKRLGLLEEQLEKKLLNKIKKYQKTHQKFFSVLSTYQH